MLDCVPFGRRTENDGGLRSTPLGERPVYDVVSLQGCGCYRAAGRRCLGTSAPQDHGNAILTSGSTEMSPIWLSGLTSARQLAGARTPRLRGTDARRAVPVTPSIGGLRESAPRGTLSMTRSVELRRSANNAGRLYPRATARRTQRHGASGNVTDSNCCRASSARFDEPSSLDARLPARSLWTELTVPRARS
jgi:hypothetical protein